MQKDLKALIFQVIDCDHTQDLIPRRMKIGHAEGMAAEVSFQYQSPDANILC